ncbi:hypothetical protein [Lysobacter sp. A03]|uniref:DUF7946 domain-containing protein n=1 Tax=Lysobacter sp. A03 TaxID=1199154 RepID=UPI0005C692BA|nr:hypothetical protein [Lysobacter sp. A03]
MEGMEMKEVRMVFHYDGGRAADGRLDVYDAAVSLRGLSRSLAITAHAFLNEGEIRTRAERADGAQIFIEAPRHGSFQEVVTIVFQSGAAETIGYSVIAAAFWDFLKWTWSAAVGRAAQPSTPTVRAMRDRIEPVLGEMAEALEKPMQELHRPIQRDRGMTLGVHRPRLGRVLLLDSTTLDYVSTSEESDLVEDLSVNVTRYNILSGYGRFFDDQEERTISFRLADDVTAVEKQLLTWSMDQRNRGFGGKILVDVRRVTNARGDVMRSIVRAVRRVPPPPPPLPH